MNISAADDDDGSSTSPLGELAEIGGRAVAELTPILDPGFSEYSYGFRPGAVRSLRSAGAPAGFTASASHRPICMG
jgi:hypothetical protein